MTVMSLAVLNENAGFIEPQILYRLPEAMRRLGWGAHAMRAARRAGLTVRYAGRCGFVLGRDIIDYIERRNANSQ
jgi:sugar/nucleoside kinase (ribokinase family)